MLSQTGKNLLDIGHPVSFLPAHKPPRFHADALHPPHDSGNMAYPGSDFVQPAAPTNAIVPMIARPVFGTQVVAPDGRLALAGLANTNPFGEVAARFNDWWTKWVSTSYADWDTSMDSIRVVFNDWMSDPNKAFPGADPEFLAQPAVIERRSGAGCSNLWVMYAGNGCTHVSEVSRVFTCYNNLVHHGFREFDYTTTRAERDKLYQAIATCSGVDVERVWPMMIIAHSLFFNPRDGHRVFPAVMYPLAWESHAENRATAKEDDTITAGVERFGKSSLDLLGSTLTTLKWIAIIGGIAVIAYYGYEFYAASRMTR